MEQRSARERLEALRPALNQDQVAYLEQAVAIVEVGEREGIPLRLLGSTAVLLNSPQSIALFQTMDRPLTDVDLVAEYRHKARIERALATLGYRVLGGRGVTMDVFAGRQIFDHPDPARPHIDVFYDKLDFCHPIDFRNRLGLGGPLTIALSDLLLEKMQIVEINEKDLKDTTILMLEHDVSTDEASGICIGRINALLGDDWGFWYTVTTNLDKVRRYAETLDILSEEQRARVAERLTGLLAAIDAGPKSMKWRMRAKVGTKKRWYAEVGEGYREV